MSTNAEQDEALAALKLADGQALLDRVAIRNNVDAQTHSTNAVALMVMERAKLRTTLRRCAVFACVLAGTWSVWFWSLH